MDLVTPSETTSSGGSVLGTLGLVAIAIVVLSGVDTFLARTERQENRAEANRLAAAGRALIDKGTPADAVAQFKGAIAIERENRAYWLELGQAQLDAGELTDAETSLTELLRRDSTAGAANLALARVLIKEGRITDAVSAYHSAVYGHWDKDAEANRLAVRFELVNVLAQQGSKEELLAELLPLLDMSPDDLSVRKRMGHLFLVAASPVRAGEIFRDILKQHPQDADAYAGLGESEFARGNYQTARADFRVASNLRPEDEGIRGRLELCSAVLALDPMQRGLGPQERYQRSFRMLELVTGAIGRCGGVVPDDAQKAMKARVGAAHMSDATETNLSMAEDLWKVRQKDCSQTPDEEDEPLRLVLAKIAQ
jgi:tetratricopeptide (TPR) repeat protein